MSDTNKDKKKALVKRGDEKYERHNANKNPKVTKPNKPTEIKRELNKDH